MRALIADDEVYIRYMIRRLIDWEAEGFSPVDDVGNSVEALSYIHKYQPDLALMDIRMPGMTGLEVAQHAAEVSPGTLIIIVSGYADFIYAQTALRNANVIDYLLKPLQAEVLLKAVRECVQRLHMRRESREEERAHALRSGMIEAIAADDWLLCALNELQSNITEDLPLSKLAQKYNVSISHLSNLIKQKLGMTYTAYVIKQRMDLGAHLLGTTNLPISKISEGVGYKDTLYFTTLFKRAYHMPPGKYRKLHKKDAPE
jgi:YesN/AraC family two-component response regulator